MKISTYTGGFVSTNSYLLSHNDTHILFDASTGSFEWLEEQGIKISHLLLTHQHWDHVDDVAKFQQAGVTVLAHSDPEEDLILEERARTTWMLPIHIETYTINKHITDRQIFNIGEISIEALHVPGHSPDSLCYKINDSVFAGDTLFKQSVGRPDLPGGNEQLLLTSIKEKLYTLADDTMIYPGHGPETSIGFEKQHNDFV